MRKIKENVKINITNLRISKIELNIKYLLKFDEIN